MVDLRQKNDKSEKLFRVYLKDKKIVIADLSKTSRSSIANTISKMGAMGTNIATCNSYENAEADIKRLKPNIVICDYDLGKKCGLELLQKQRNEMTETQKSIFILVTGNSSQTAVARAAEEDVDTFIIKPFSADVLKNSIMKAAVAKLQPSEYKQLIEQGKRLMEEQQIDEALAIFKQAQEKDSAPSLACAYTGQAELMKKIIEEAQESYTKGLSFNKIHYKCMVGYFDTLMAQKRYKEAYEVVKKVSQYFPANPKRLASVLRLAIMTESYEDVEKYYQLFTTIEDRAEELIRYVCAALVVCGKYYLQKNFGSRAMELFRKAAISAGSRTNILKEIITSLLEFDLTNEAMEFYKRFPPDSQKEESYHVLGFMISSRKAAPNVVVNEGQNLIRKGVHDPLLYKTIIKKARTVGMKDLVESLSQEAINRWPDQKNSFLKLSKMAAATADAPAKPAPEKEEA